MKSRIYSVIHIETVPHNLITDEESIFVEALLLMRLMKLDCLLFITSNGVKDIANGHQMATNIRDRERGRERRIEIINF